jgi:hypothetical protein
VDEGFPVGMVYCERKGEQTRDSPRGGVLRGKGADIPLHAACRFKTQAARSAGYTGSTYKPLSEGGTCGSPVQTDHQRYILKESLLKQRIGAGAIGKRVAPGRAE